MDSVADRYAYLALPGYGPLTAPAAIGFIACSSGTMAIEGQNVTLSVERQYTEFSLLAHNFNGHWCAALNQRLQGQRLDYFAMQHSDIEPEKFWMDRLIAEMEECDLDVLGVVAPLKSTDGLTSIALDSTERSPWAPLCRLTMKEVYDLPETFTEEDTGHPILLNTGLWACRFNFEKCRQIHFQVNDRIRMEGGKYVAEVEPEDWNFSRQCHALGMRVGVTRKVKLNHAGSQRFSNGFAWGEQHFDSKYVSESVLPPADDYQPQEAAGDPLVAVS